MKWTSAEPTAPGYYWLRAVDVPNQLEVAELVVNGPGDGRLWEFLVGADRAVTAPGLTSYEFSDEPLPIPMSEA